MQKSIKNQIKNFLIVTLSVLMMMPNTVAAFAKEGTDEKKIEKLELSTTYDDYDIVATTEKDSLPEGAKLHVTEVAKEYQDLSDVYLTEEKGYETAKKQYFNVSFEDGDGNKLNPTKKVELSLKNEKLGDKNIKVSLYSISADRLVEMKKDTEKVEEDKKEGKETELTKFEFKPLDIKKSTDDENKVETSIEKMDEVYMLRYSYQPKTLDLSAGSISYDELLTQTGLVGQIQNLEVSNSSYIVAKDQKIEKVEDFSSEMFALVTINGLTYKVNFAPTVKAEEENTEDPSLRSVERNTTVKDVHIGDFNTKLVGGVDKGTNVWTVPTINTGGYAAGHMFVFRVNFSISGVDEVGENAVMFTVPKSILLNRNGQASDKYEMSIPHQREVDAMMAGTGEQIDQDVNFAYYEDGDNIVIYNFRKLAAGTEGYVEVGYHTAESSYEYRDMAESKPFTAKMELGSEVRNSDPLTVKINTTANIASSAVKYPTKNKTWIFEGEKPANADNYTYLSYVVESTVFSTQPYNFKLEATSSDYEVVGYVFSGKGGKFQSSNGVTDQVNPSNKRFDTVIIRIPNTEFENKTYLKNTLKVNAVVTPVDGIDATTSKESSQNWEWSKPTFSVPYGSFNVHKKEGMRLRYDLDSFNGYDNAEITMTEYQGMRYNSDIEGYPYPWTRDESKNIKDPSAYGQHPVTYQFTDEGIYLTTDKERGESPSSDGVRYEKGIPLTSDDAYIESVNYRYITRTVHYDTEEAIFKYDKEKRYDESDIITLQIKHGQDEEFKTVGTYNFLTSQANYDSNFVSNFTSETIEFSRKDIIAYRMTFSNKHYFSAIYAYPMLTLKNSEKVMNFVKGKERIGLANNVNGQFFNYKNEKILETNSNAVDYARVTQRSSEVEKRVVSSSNNAKQRVLNITWRISADEQIVSGQSGKIEYVVQNGGTFYDLLPLGSVLDKSSIIINKREGGTVSPADYTVTTTDNFNGTGRTMFRLDIKDPSEKYTVFFDTTYSWNNLKDFGTNIYNPVAYKTGNTSIAGGTADNGGRFDKNGKAPKNQIKENMTGLDSEESDDWTSGISKFIYAEEVYDANNLTAATSGLTKKVKAEKDKKYSYETMTNIGKEYSYELRMANSGSSKAKDIIFYDSLENYVTEDGRQSDWHGILNSIGLKQLEARGIKPVVYISTVENLSIDDHRDLTDSSIWQEVTDLSNVSNAKAIAIDASKKADGTDFVLDETESLTAYLYMQAPNEANDVGRIPMAYNNIYMNATILGSGNKAETHFVHQDYTQIGLKISGNLMIKKVSENDTALTIEGIEYKLSGISNYGTVYDETVKTGSSGSAMFSDVELGTYTLQEYKATKDWLLDTTTRIVTIDKSNNVIVDGINYTNKELILSDKPRIHTDINFKKSELGNSFAKVSGAIFKLYGTSDYGTNIVKFATSNSDGEVKFEDVEKGRYTIKEIALENQRYVPNKELTVNILVDEFGKYSTSSDNSEYYKNETVFNEHRYNGFKLRKIDADNNSIWLEGAEFLLKGVSELGTSTNITATSDENGVLTFENIEKGTYTLKEITAPTNVTATGKKGGNRNYIKDPKEYIVHIDKIGKVVIDGLEKEDATGFFIVKNERAEDGKITVKKMWDDADKPNEKRPIPQLTMTASDPNINNIVYTLDFGEIPGLPENERKVNVTLSKEGIENVRNSSNGLSSYIISEVGKEIRKFAERNKEHLKTVLPDNYWREIQNGESLFALEMVNDHNFTEADLYTRTFVLKMNVYAVAYLEPHFLNKIAAANNLTSASTMGKEFRLNLINGPMAKVFINAMDFSRDKVAVVSSENSSYKIYAVVKDGIESEINLYSEAATVFLPKDSSELFKYDSNSSNENIFKFRELYLANFSFTKVENATEMFANQHATLDLPMGITGHGSSGNLKIAKGMFLNFKEATSGWIGEHIDYLNVENVTDFEDMFKGSSFATPTPGNTGFVRNYHYFAFSIDLTELAKNKEKLNAMKMNLGGSIKQGKDSLVSLNFYNTNIKEFARLSDEDISAVFNKLIGDLKPAARVTIGFSTKNMNVPEANQNRARIQSVLKKLGFSYPIGVADMGMSRTNRDTVNINRSNSQYSPGVISVDWNELGWRPVPEPAEPEVKQMLDGTITYRSQADKWVKSEDNVWTYTFNVFDDTLEYKLFEETMDGYTSEAMLPKYAIVNGTQSKVATITNKSTVGTGSFHLSKVVNGELVPGASYTFFLTFSNPNGFFNKPRVLSGVSIFNGHAMVQLKGGQDLVIEGLPEGTVVGVHEQAGSYQATYSAENVTIESGKQSDIVCTNTFTPPEPGELGDVTLVKKVSGIADENTEYPFRVEFSNLVPNRTYATSKHGFTFNSDNTGHALVDLKLKKDQLITFEELPVNATYQVTELAGAYTSKYELSDVRGINKFNSENGLNEEENKDLSTAIETVDADENVSITFTNTIEHKQSLVVTKVEPEATTEKYPFSIQFSNMKPNSFFNSDIGLVRADENGEATKDFTLGNGESVKFTDIPVGVEYKVVEQANKKLAKYTLTADKENFANATKENDEAMLDLATELETVDDGEDATVTFTNITPPSAKIQLTKFGENNEKLGGATYALYKGTFFIKNIDINSNGKSDEIDGIGVGNYYLIETKAPEGYALDPNKHEFEIKKNQLNTTVQIELHDDKLKVLPSTGGRGMIAFVIIAMILLGGAGYLVISAKKKGKN